MDITQDFKRISEEIIKIECQLRHMHPELSVYVANVQDYEKQQLELVTRMLVCPNQHFIHVPYFLQTARLQLAKQELQDRRHDDSENELLKGEVHKLKKDLANIQEKINENMEAVCYQVADLM